MPMRGAERVFLCWKRSLAFLSVAFFLGIDLPGYGAAVPRDSYVAGGISDARVLIPFLADDTASSSICELIFNGLTKVDKDLRVTGDLARSWKISEDGRLITFYLRDNVRWHDGKAFTAEDVKFTYEQILDPSNGSPYIGSYSMIREVRVLDEHTVSFEYEEPYAPALLKLGMGILPQHILRGAEDIRSSDFATRPVGTGPYRFGRWKNGEYIVLEANRDYFEGVPGIKRYVYRIIPDQAVAFLELVSGGVDSVALSPYQYRYRSRTKDFVEKIEKYKYPSHSYVYIGYNLKDPLFSDKRVRRALSYAVDTRKIIDSVLLGLGSPSTGPFLKGSPFYDESVEGYPYDPGRAEALLKEAGWEDTDGDGILDRDGVPLSFTVATNQGSRVREDTATIVQSQWAEIGVDAKIRVVAWSAFLDQFVNKKNFQAVILGWTTPIDPDIYSVWHSDSSREGGLNFVSYSNGRVDALIEEGRREFDTRKRREIYHELHGLISRDAPYTFLFVPYSTPAVNRRFKGIEPSPAGIGYNFIEWYVPEEEVKYKF
ncbi:MAG: peptide-binding protein [Candidatus Omnitrophica bacterium]|nr:peptide-binding protein [Candidatus Omnitrophota bacterium]